MVSENSIHDNNIGKMSTPLTPRLSIWQNGLLYIDVPLSWSQTFNPPGWHFRERISDKINHVSNNLNLESTWRIKSVYLRLRDRLIPRRIAEVVVLLWTKM